MLNAELLKRYSRVLDFDWHEGATRYLMSEANTRAIVKGNQGGGTAVTTMDAILRLMGIHPVIKRNVLNKPIRFVSKTLPKSDMDEENQQYVEFKRRFPPEFIKKDITYASPVMTLRDPGGGSDKKVEFMSMKQDLDAFMSVQRSAYYQDEEIDRIKWDENQMRLLKEGGDTSVTFTPVKGFDWAYDAIWCRASVIYRSKTITDVYGYPSKEERDSGSDIECFCWATDDNPVMKQSDINRIFADIVDPDELAMRRYGVFKQSTGRIFKLYDKQIHVIKWDDYWDPTAFKKYWHYRIIDFHPSKPWYISWVAISPANEWFVWNEYKADHNRASDFDLRDEIKRLSVVDEDDEMNRCTLIDPLAKVKQANTGYSVYEDITMGYDGLRRVMPADTKNQQGRSQINWRLKNSLECEVPGNNIRTDGIEDFRFGNRLPTIWFFDTVKGHHEHMEKWRYIEYRQEHIKAVKDEKRESQKYSDFCRNLEFLGALNPVWYMMKKTKNEPRHFFNANARAI